jgi:deoxyribodipyrimidine photo-lyase
MHELGIFIFHRDLRIVDNIGLYESSKLCKKLVPIFIFTPQQISAENKFRSQNAIQFMIESLDDLDQATGSKLLCFYGDTVDVLSKLIGELEPGFIAFNRDYTPFARKRGAQVAELCEKKGVECKTFADYYLFEPGTLTKNGFGEENSETLKEDVYKKFTPFYNKALANKKHIAKSVGSVTKFYNPKEESKRNLRFLLIDLKEKYLSLDLNPDIINNGGRENGKQILANLPAHYSTERNTLSIPTSLLSPFIKFGCISVREAYEKFSEPIKRQLFWRDFYAHVLYAFPNLGHPVDPKYEKIAWDNNRTWFTAWCNGKTGFPVVDACMRQLNTTGYMHNRGRLIVASFLTKTLLIDWRWGEKYFAQNLVDYDVASNSQNWLWIAGGGADSQEYFRIFSPWEQSKKNDPDCVYIKQWVPELANVENRKIHNWYKDFDKDVYFEPIVDYAEQKKKVLAAYKKIFV